MHNSRRQTEQAMVQSTTPRPLDPLRQVGGLAWC